MAELFHDLILNTPPWASQRYALVYQGKSLLYGELAESVARTAGALGRLGLRRGDRVAVYMEKRMECVLALFGSAAAGGAFVPINPLLKPEQVAYIMRDCGVRILVTTAERFTLLGVVLQHCPNVRAVIVIGAPIGTGDLPETEVVHWKEALDSAPYLPRLIDSDIAAILYTSGSTGKPKGVVLSHRNLVAGAKSVAQYLQNDAEDRILCALPLSFDYGLSQLSTAFHTGACAILINYLLPRDIIKHVEKERVTGLAAVPALWTQLAQLEWPAGIDEYLRYITNSGGRMPKVTLSLLRSKLPKTRPYLMYGLTEAFRSTYLPPEEVDRRPDSIGKAIPNAEVLVVRPDGTHCAPDEPGELVHRGALVAMGYWNDAEKTAERFRPAPGQPAELPIKEMAVWSGDTVRIDKEGFLYFIERRDEMIKSSGYRISPTEVEEVLYSTEIVAEVAAIGVPHPVWGHAVVAIAVPSPGTRVDTDTLLRHCQQHLPAFMVPALITIWDGSLPRNANGKIDRKSLTQSLCGIFEMPTDNE